MTPTALRVAFFADAYNEVDGVANTARQFESFALRRNYTFLTVHGGISDRLQTEGSGLRMMRRRGRFGFPLDKKQDFDLAFWRHLNAVEKVVRDFDPDILHITGPSDVGQLGVAIAHRLRIPLAASWPTNVHQYAEQRAASLLSILPGGLRRNLSSAIQKGSLLATLRFYHIAQILFAPTRSLSNSSKRERARPVIPYIAEWIQNCSTPRGAPATEALSLLATWAD